MSSKVVIVLLAVVVVAVAENVSFASCSEDCWVESVRISPCPKPDRNCRVKSGSYVTLTVDFTPYFSAHTVKAVAYSLGFFNVEVLKLNNACDNMSCPVEGWKSNRFTHTAQLPELWFDQTYDVRVELQNKANKYQKCCVRRKFTVLA